MVTIREGTAPLTVINIFSGTPQNQPEVIRLISEMVGQTVCRLPGFLSSSIHASLDGTRVVVYAQWESVEDHAAMFASPDVQDHLHRIADIAGSEANLYQVTQIQKSLHARDADTGSEGPG